MHHAAVHHGYQHTKLVQVAPSMHCGMDKLCSWILITVEYFLIVTIVCMMSVDVLSAS